MATISREGALSLLLGAMLAGAGCAPSGQASGHSSPAPLSPSPTARTAAASPVADTGGPDDPRFQFKGDALERVEGASHPRWRAKLPPESSRQMAVLGETVLVWGSAQTLRRFDVATGRQSAPPVRVGQVLQALASDEVLVQSTPSGMAGVGEKAELWRRPDLKTASMVLAGPSERPLVLLVASGDGRARAIDLESGRDAKFPVPDGAFSQVALESDSGVLTWLPKAGGQPIMTDGASGETI